MLFQRFEEKGLAHYSYLVGCEEKGQVAVIDPRRDVEIYLEYAEKNRLVISHVFETHIHADYASGARELAKRARATLCLSGYDKGEAYEVSFAHRDCFEGDLFRLGSIELKVLHTPGHTPEHLSFLLYDLQKSSTVPTAIFSGDFLLLGTVGRPDLLGKEAAADLAKKLYHSIQEKLKGLPDELDIFPAHGSGSFCGSGINDRPFSKLGFEKLSNPFLNPGLSEKDFVSQLLQRELPIPPYYT
ncbi:MBL fold metallo-hydrolase [Simkania sp.]|uniref:MBL fold metallo-hydrolase n=1 Tax=Simkania sp. TaxID=34094 RepID=UPI003B5180A7